MHKILLCLLAASAVSLSACSTTKENGVMKPLEVVASVNLEKYMGTWYETGRYPNRFQEGCVALLHAIDKTANTTACRLSTCAQEWIRGAMLRFLQGQRTPVHVPVNALPRLRLSQTMPQRVPLELAREYGDDARDEGFVHPAETLARRELRPMLERLFECLTAKQRQVIALRYGLADDGVEHSLEETARLIGISFQEVDRREKRAIERVQACGSRELLRELALCLA